MPINRIVVVGDGLAAWLCASALSRTVAKAIRITVIGMSGSDKSETDSSLGMPLAACSSGPAIMQFNRSLGYDESALIAATRGGYTLGSAITGWCPSTVFNPFGDVGSPLGPVSFQQLSLRLQAIGRPIKLANYSLAALCAQAGRFAKPASNEDTVLSELHYGVQIDIPAYARMLKADATSRGVTEIQSRYERAEIDEAGLIQEVIAKNDSRVPGDLFIDCTGAARVLYNSVAAKNEFVDWSSWLPASWIDNVVVASNDAPLPFVHLNAMPSGWRSTISLPEKRCEIHCSAEPHADSGFNPGFLANPWKGNCVAIGGSAIVLDPASSLAFDLLYSSIPRLISLIPNDRHCEQEMFEFNRQSNAEAECARDYVIALYKLNGINGQVFWDRCRSMAIPDSLSHRIEIYKSCGRVVMRDGEMVDRMNWTSLFDAGGVHPEQYDVVARSLPMELVTEHLTAIRQTLLEAVSTLPSYHSYLSKT